MSHTSETALELGQAFDTSAELWTDLESSYRLQLAAQREQGDAIERRGRLWAIAPVRELLRLGWIRESADEDRLERDVLDFLQLRSLDESRQSAASSRCSTARPSDERSVYAWLRRAQAVADQQQPTAYDLERLAAGIPALFALSRRPEQVRQVPGTLLKLGVRCTIVPRLERTSADGAAVRIAEAPVVALTLRLDRIASFWFTLTYELAHLTLGHGANSIDETNDAACPGDAREEGRQGGVRSAGSRRAYRAFLKGRRRFPLADVTAFAESIGRHPGIVVGRLHHDGRLNHKYLRATLEKVGPCLRDRIYRPWPLTSKP